LTPMKLTPSAPVRLIPVDRVTSRPAKRDPARSVRMTVRQITFCIL